MKSSMSSVASFVSSRARSITCSFNTTGRVSIVSMSSAPWRKRSRRSAWATSD